MYDLWIRRKDGYSRRGGRCPTTKPDGRRQILLAQTHRHCGRFVFVYSRFRIPPREEVLLFCCTQHRDVPKHVFPGSVTRFTFRYVKLSVNVRNGCFREGLHHKLAQRDRGAIGGFATFFAASAKSLAPPSLSSTTCPSPPSQFPRREGHIVWPWRGWRWGQRGGAVRGGEQGNSLCDPHGSRWGRGAVRGGGGRTGERVDACGVRMGGECDTQGGAREFLFSSFVYDDEIVVFKQQKL